jgi:hypothetical protein
MREPHRLVLEALSVRARTDESNERPDVNEPRLVPAYPIEQQPRTPLGVRYRILAGFAYGRRQIEGIWSGGINDQIVAGYPLVKLTRFLGIAR